MKSRLTAFAALLFAAALTLAQAEDIKTVTGKEYKNVKISRAEPDGLVIIASYGIIKIPFEELPVDLQQKYHHDPVASAQFRKRLDDATTERTRQIAAVQKQRALEQAAAVAFSSQNAPAATTAPPSQAPQGPPQPAAIRPPMQETSSLSRPAYAKAASAEQIFFDYASNEIQAEAQYKGQRYALGGKIDSISSKDGVGIVAIRVPFHGSETEFWNRSAHNVVYFMDAYFPDPSVLIPYRVGRQIGFNGRIEGVQRNILTVKDCYFPR